jgi:hypothetical protein
LTTKKAPLQTGLNRLEKNQEDIMTKAQSKRLINPVTGKYHLKWKTLHRSIGNEIKKLEIKRGIYDEIVGWGGDANNTKIHSKQIIKIFRSALDEEYVEFDRRRRGTALNHDLYGYDPAQGVAVIQARQAIGSKYGIRTRKTYFLVGRNEITKEYFRHPVSAHTVRAAISKDTNPVLVVKKVQMWMWEVTEKQLYSSSRQGDILLVPERSIPKIEPSGTTFTVADSHQIKADEIRLNGRCYAKNPTVTHAKGQHASVAFKGWCSIRVARQSDAWDFADRIGD